MRNNLISFRKSLGMTQEQFGEFIGEKKQIVSNLETARLIGNGLLWMKIQKKFGLSVNETLDLMVVQPNERT